MKFEEIRKQPNEQTVECCVWRTTMSKRTFMPRNQSKKNNIALRDSSIQRQKSREKAGEEERYWMERRMKTKAGSTVINTQEPGKKEGC